MITNDYRNYRNSYVDFILLNLEIFDVQRYYYLFGRIKQYGNIDISQLYCFLFLVNLYLRL